MRYSLEPRLWRGLTLRQGFWWGAGLFGGVLFFVLGQAWGFYPRLAVAALPIVLGALAAYLEIGGRSLEWWLIYWVAYNLGKARARAWQRPGPGEALLLAGTPQAEAREEPSREKAQEPPRQARPRAFPRPSLSLAFAWPWPRPAMPRKAPYRRQPPGQEQELVGAQRPFGAAFTLATLWAAAGTLGYVAYHLLNLR